MVQIGMDEWLDGVLARARDAYGDLRAPTDRFFVEALRDQPWRGVVDRLREFLVVREVTDREDGVSFAYVLTRPRRWTWSRLGVQRRADDSAWVLWLSAVGPYGLVGYGAAGAELAREEVVTAPFAGGPEEQRPVFDVLRGAGVHLLSAEQVETSVPEFRPFRSDEDTVTPTVFTLLFGGEDVPWHHAW